MSNEQVKLEKNTTKVRQRPQRKERNSKSEEKSGVDFKIINIRRVTRMHKGGRRLRLSVFVVAGDRNGKVGLGIGKGDDVKSAQGKAIKSAQKNMVAIPLKGNTIPHEIEIKYGSARIVVRPASPGTGVVAGSSMRMIAELAGIKDMLGKILGTSNKISNAYATMKALESLRSTRL